MFSYIKSINVNGMLLPALIAILSCVFGSFISTLPSPFPIVCILLAAAAMIFYGWQLWWLIFPVFAFIGSNFNIGFKIYPEEIGFALSCSVLLVLVLLKRAHVLRRHNKINITFLILIAYIIIHMAMSLFAYPSGILDGAGSIIRIYAASLVWLIFSFLLFRYSSTDHIRIIFIVCLLVLLVRNVVTASQLYGQVNPLTEKSALLVLPSLDELRLSALLSLYVSIIIYYIVRSRTARIAVIIYALAMVSLVALGQGRVSTATTLMILVSWILLTKKATVIVPFLTILVIVFATININTSILSLLPFQAQRAISFVPVEKGLDVSVSKNTSSSDDWHKELLAMGIAKWSNSPVNVVLGSHIDPTDSKDFITLPYNRMLEVAANTARYENALGTILATLGLVGFCLYARLFWLLSKDIVPEVMRHGIHDYKSAVFSVAFMAAALFVVFIWIRGSFPGFEILFCVMAKILYDDTKANRLNTPGQSQC